MINRSSIKIAKPGDQILFEFRGGWYLGVLFSLDSHGFWSHGTARLDGQVATLEVRVTWDALDRWFKAIDQPIPDMPPTLEA